MNQGPELRTYELRLKKGPNRPYLTVQNGEVAKLLTAKDLKGTVRSVPEEKERLAKIIVFRSPITRSTMKGRMVQEARPLRRGEEVAEKVALLVAEFRSAPPDV